jgi:hypothetical protein
VRLRFLVVPLIEQARVAEMALGADRDNEEYMETQRLTGMMFSI